MTRVLRSPAMRAGMVLVGALTLVAACDRDDDNDSRSATAGLPSTAQFLEAHEWLLDGPAGSPVIDAGGPATIAFVDDTAHGTGPCNTFRARLSVDGNDVSISDLAATSRTCGRAIDEAETAYFTALDAITGADLDDDENRLTLTGPGDTRLVFDSYDVDEVIEAEWQITNVATGDAIVGVPSDVAASITFEDGGTALIETGCNTGDADWELDGDLLAIESVVITERACPDIEGATEFERAVLDALAATTEVEATPASLTLLDEDGSIVLIAVTS